MLGRVCQSPGASAVSGQTCRAAHHTTSTSTLSPEAAGQPSASRARPVSRGPRKSPQRFVGHRRATALQANSDPAQPWSCPRGQWAQPPRTARGTLPRDFVPGDVWRSCLRTPGSFLGPVTSDPTHFLPAHRRLRGGPPGQPPGRSGTDAPSLLLVAKWTLPGRRAAGVAGTAGTPASLTPLPRDPPSCFLAPGSTPCPDRLLSVLAPLGEAPGPPCRSDRLARLGCGPCSRGGLGVTGGAGRPGAPV